MLDQHFFNPSINIQKNIERYSSARPDAKITILPCIIQRVYHNLKADIYIPFTSTVMESLPIIFDSFSEEQGNINLPEENSLSLCITTSDGRRFVWGGISLSNTYMVRNILPGESERYVKNASYKQDIMGNHVFLSKLCNTEIFSQDGINHHYAEGSCINNGVYEEFSGSIRINASTERYIRIHKIYQSSVTEEVSFDGVFSEEKQDLILKKNQEIQDKICGYLVNIQNLKENYSDERMREIKEKIHSEYQKQKKVCMIIEEGTATNKDIKDRLDFSDLSEADFAYAADHTHIIYRVRTFNLSGEMTSCYSVSESGLVDFWEKKEEFLLVHNMDDYPMVSLLQSSPSSPCLKVLDCEVVYMDRNTIKLSLNRKYGVVKRIEEKCLGKFEISMENGEILNVELGCSTRKLEEIIKRVLSSKK